MAAPTGQTRHAGCLDYGGGSGREKWTFEIHYNVEWKGFGSRVKIGVR